LKYHAIGARFFLFGVLLCSILASGLCGKTEHTALSDAHHDASLLAKQFYQDVDHLTAIDKPETLRRTDILAQSLDRVREAEKKCTASGVPRGKVAAWNYQQMLVHERIAFDDLALLRRELSGSTPQINHVVSMIADIERQMDIAEEAHCDCRATS
jgi:hypothetical protein